MLGQRVARLSTLPFLNLCWVNELPDYPHWLSTLPFLKFMLGQRVARLSTLAFFLNLCWVNELLDYPHWLFSKLMLGQWIARLSTLSFFLIYVGSMSC
jgi:hypothetical protein